MGRDAAQGRSLSSCVSVTVSDRYPGADSVITVTLSMVSASSTPYIDIALGRSQSVGPNVSRTGVMAQAAVPAIRIVIDTPAGGGALSRTVNVAPPPLSE